MSIKEEQKSPLLMKLIDHKNGFSGHHIESMNTVYSDGIDAILNSFKSETIIFPKNSIAKTVHLSVHLSDVHVDKPYSRDGATKRIILPSQCYKSGTSYDGKLNFNINVDVKIVGENSEVIDTISSTFRRPEGYDCPILTLSNRCNLENNGKKLTPEQLLINDEHPYNQGAYFVADGNIWIPLTIENRVYNYNNCFKNDFKGEATRSEYLAKPGEQFENSYNVIIRLLKKGQLNIEIDHKPFVEMQIPFYCIFRLLGASSDRDIINYIYYEEPNEQGTYSSTYYKIMRILTRALTLNSSSLTDINEKVSATDIATTIIDKLKEIKSSNKEVIRYDIKTFYDLIDKYLYYDLGDKEEDRPKKLIKLGQEIRTLLLVNLTVFPSTNRDELKYKYMLAAGPCFAKVLKTCLNSSIINPILRKLKDEFTKMGNKKLDISSVLSTALTKSSLSNDIRTAIKPKGDIKTRIINPNKERKISMQTELLNTKNKNFIYYLCMLNMVMTPGTASDKNKRAGEIREVQPTQDGFYCVVSTAISGKPVGLQKNFACTAEITNYINHGPDIILLLQDDAAHDDLIIDERKLRDPCEIYNGNYCKVAVLGVVIGYTKQPEVVKYKYRMMRRFQHDKLHIHTSITYDAYRNMINFNTHIGRMTRLAFVVDNNMFELLYARKKDYKAINNAFNNFEQHMRITDKQVQELLSSKITIKQLIDEGCLEYIFADEIDENYICPDPTLFETRRHDPTYMYTHVQLPNCIYSIAALTQVYAQYNPASRNAYQAAQVKQVGGYNDHYNKFEKELFHQYIYSKPIITSVAYNYSLPNGMSGALAIVACNSDNEEDSYGGSKSAMSVGAFYGIRFNIKDRTLLTNEEIKDPRNIPERKINIEYNYDKVLKQNPPIIKVGSVVNKGDVLMCIVKQENTPDLKKKYTETSFVYNNDEQGIIDDIIHIINAKGYAVYKFKVRLFRPSVSQDKYSTRHGQKGIIGGFFSRADMIKNKWGMIPILVANTHAFPTRMTIAQIIEMYVSKYAAILGINIDGTTFMDANVEVVREWLHNNGFSNNGTEVFYNKQGKRINNPIFFGPVYIQRIQKFAVELCYSVNNPTRDRLTGQPVQGFMRDGGLKLGEMETDVLLTHGTMKVVQSKMFNDSDPFTIHICIKCNTKMKVYNKQRELCQCSNCGERFNDVAVDICSTANLLMDELAFMNIQTLLYPAPYIKVN